MECRAGGQSSRKVETKLLFTSQVPTDRRDVDGGRWTGRYRPRSDQWGEDENRGTKGEVVSSVRVETFWIYSSTVIGRTLRG